MIVMTCLLVILLHIIMQIGCVLAWIDIIFNLIDICSQVVDIQNTLKGISLFIMCTVIVRL